MRFLTNHLLYMCLVDFSPVLWIRSDPDLFTGSGITVPIVLNPARMREQIN